MKPRHLLAITAYCGFLFWMSSGPVAPPKPIAFDGLDKAAHAAAYGLLAVLVFHGLRQSGKPWTTRALFWIPVLFAALYGAGDELHQYFVPTRSCDFFDWIADLNGALAAAAALVWFFRKPVSEPLPASGE